MADRYIDVKPIEGLDVQLGLLLSMFADGTNEWRDELEDLKLPQEALTWQPFENGHSIGGVILHIADVEAFWISTVAAQRPISDADKKRFLSEETQQYNIQWPTPPNEPLSYYWEICDEVRRRSLKLVREMANPEHAASRSRGEETRHFTLRWILHHVLTHEAYHGGQAVLLGMMYQKTR